MSDCTSSDARFVGGVVVELALGRRAVVVADVDTRAVPRLAVAAGVVGAGVVVVVVATEVTTGDDDAVLPGGGEPPSVEHALASSTVDTVTAVLRSDTDTASPLLVITVSRRSDRSGIRAGRETPPSTPSAPVGTIRRVGHPAARGGPPRPFLMVSENRWRRSYLVSQTIARLPYDGPMSALSRSRERALPVASYPGKRSFDVVVAAIGLILTAPVQAVVSALIRWKMGDPILFRQVRPGLHAQPFELLKFRTMLTPEQAGGVADDAGRLTPLGAWLRASSLDELPSLWNVLRGDLSLVGPRPLLMHYVPHYSPEQARRHEARPGITGLAQVSGRNALDWERRFELDVSYVDRCSPLLDLLILVRTIVPVLRRRGVSAPGEATVRPFTPAPEPGACDS